jgi:hypothetical protein
MLPPVLIDRSWRRVRWDLNQIVQRYTMFSGTRVSLQHAASLVQTRANAFLAMTSHLPGRTKRHGRARAMAWA